MVSRVSFFGGKRIERGEKARQTQSEARGHNQSQGRRKTRKLREKTKSPPAKALRLTGSDRRKAGGLADLARERNQKLDSHRGQRSAWEGIEDEEEMRRAKKLGKEDGWMDGWRGRQTDSREAPT